MASVNESPWYLGGASPASGRLKFLLSALVILMAALIWSLRYEASDKKLHHADANDYAQMGRQLYRGEGFSSLKTFPYIIGWLAARDESTNPPWPNVNRFPLPCLQNALVFSIFGVGNFGAILFGGIFLVGTALLVFLLGNRLFGPLVGLVASVLTFTSVTQLYYSITGLSESGAAFFIMAIALGYSFAAEKNKRMKRWAFLLGLVIGVGFLQRYNLILFAVPIGILHLAGPERRGLRSVMAMIGGILTAASPWFIYHFLRFGSPLVSTTATRNLLTEIAPWDIFLSLKQYNIWHVVWTHSDVLLGKLCSSWLLKNWHVLFGPEFRWLGPLFLVCVFAARSRRALSFWLFCFGGFLITFLAYSVTETVVRFYRPFTPLLLVVFIGSGAMLLRYLPQRFHFILLLTSLAVVVTSSVFTLKRIGKPPAKQHLNHQVFESIRSLVDPGTVVIANRSWFIAWLSDRPTVHFDGSIPQLLKIDNNYTRIGAIYLQGPKARAFKRRLNRHPMGKQFRIARNFSRDEIFRGATLWVRKRAGPPSPK